MAVHLSRAKGERRAIAAGAAAALVVAASLVQASLAAASPPAAGAGAATVVLAARSIGSRRGDPLDRRSHAALLVRLDGRPGGFIVQGGKEPAPGSLLGRHRVVGWAIPAEDPSAEFARAVGGWWGEPGARQVPTRELARFAVKGLGEARLRELVESLNREFQGRDYRLEGGPSSNSFVSRLLDRLGISLPPLGDVELPGWGWRP